MIDVKPTLMVSQSLEFLAERAGTVLESASSNISRFFSGMRYWRRDRAGALYLVWDFENADALFDFDLAQIPEAVSELEIHLDISLSYDHFAYLADQGLGPQLELMHVNRRPFPRGMAFEIEERGAVTQSLLAGPFTMNDRTVAAHQHYSTAMTLLAAEDAVAGLVDAAYLQFYLASEAVLGEHERSVALRAGHERFGPRFSGPLEAIVSRVYIARHRFFGHAHPGEAPRLRDENRAFGIAKQVLVARWCARRLLSLELGRDLVAREMRLYAPDNKSVVFDGDADLLNTDFALP